MRTILSAVPLSVSATCVVAQQTSEPDQNSRNEGVVQRGDHVMGFSAGLPGHASWQRFRPIQTDSDSRVPTLLVNALPEASVLAALARLF
jgi:hypothetical protein